MLLVTCPAGGPRGLETVGRVQLAIASRSKKDEFTKCDWEAELDCCRAVQLRPVNAAKAAVQCDLSTYVAYHREALLWLARPVASRLTYGPEPLHEGAHFAVPSTSAPKYWTVATTNMKRVYVETGSFGRTQDEWQEQVCVAERRV